MSSRTHDHDEHADPQHGGPMDDATAEWYVEKWGDHPSNHMAVKLAQLRPDDVVLDIGCGSGTAVREVALLVTQGRVIGVDPTPAMRRIAAEQSADHVGSQRITYYDGDAGHLPLPDDTVSVALAINTLHHWHDPSDDLLEVQRVLAPGGRLLVCEEDLKDGRMGHGEGPLAEPKHVAHLLEVAGFVDVKISHHVEDDTRVILITGSCLDI